jgi:hypothetical protein
VYGTTGMCSSADRVSDASVSALTSRLASTDGEDAPIDALARLETSVSGSEDRVDADSGASERRMESDRSVGVIGESVGACAGGRENENGEKGEGG